VTVWPTHTTLVFTLGITCMQPVLSPAADISNFVTGRWGINTEQGDTQIIDLAWQPELRWRFDDGGRLTSVARLRQQTEDGLRPSDMEQGAYGLATKPLLIGDNTEMDLRELYYERSAGDWYLTIGKQQVVWGKADGLKVLDVVDPQSFREFILEDFEQSRIPLWTLNVERTFADLQGRSWTLQLLWIPDKTYHALPRRNGTYAFTSPRLVPQAPPGIDVRLDSPKLPDRFVQDSDAGLRLSGFTGGWDVTINYLYQYDNQPVLHQQFLPGAIPTVGITPRYHRTHIFGGTLSRAFGDWVVRGELGYFTRRYFISNDPSAIDGVASSAELSYVTGLDWSGLTDTFISLQLFQSRLIDYQQDFTRPELDTNITFLARRNFELEIRAGLDIFYGNRSGLFGQFDDNDRFYIGIRYDL